MKLTIRVRYHTRIGQALFLCGDYEAFGGGQLERALPLHYTQDGLWETTVDLPDSAPAGASVNYYFIVRGEDGSVTEDFGGDRTLALDSLPKGHTVIIDSWNDLSTVENIFWTEPFKNVLLRIEKPATDAHLAAAASHGFRVKAPLLPPGQTLCLLGGSDALGRWNTAAPILLSRSPGDRFSVSLNLPAHSLPIEYKYGVYDLAQKAFVRYEDGANRVLTQPAPDGGRVLLNDGFVRLPARIWRGAGVAIPVFSLRSERSLGAGEFLDVTVLADWGRRVGLKLIQILPVNDTTATHTWMDSYPYSGISAFALHPLYLNVDALAEGDARLLKSIAATRRELNALPAIDYEAVMKAKWAFLRTIFSQRRQSDLASAEYKTFFAQNDQWLVPYAAFCCLRDRFGTADFAQWPEHRNYDAAKIAALASIDPAAREEMEFHQFVQFHLHRQLRETAEYIHAQGLILKGDIAIGVYPHSADVWQQPELFHTDMQAGAPPDPFAAKGQNWGFPTYNWPRMKQDGFDWWKRRFSQMSHYFDAFRIDHILGFFRIWSIPRHAVEGILGYFVPALPVERAEFSARGISFDHERFTLPFINDEVLREMFGNQAASVKRSFLKRAKDGTYALKPKFETQRVVEDYFASLPEERRDAKLREGLFDLISNVLLIEAPDGGLHFRLDMEKTPSFQQLDPKTQAIFKELYVDYFYHRQDDFWRREAMSKLPALKRVTNMLVCGEDLGMVPDCVPGVMKDLALVALEVQRMPKGQGSEFSRPARAPYLTVVTPSTHDMSTVRGWWLEERKITQKFFNEELGQPGVAPRECEIWVSREIIRQHLESPAIWSIFQLQDLLGIDQTMRNPDVAAERINIPAVPRYYWRYRMHLTLERVIRSEDFNWLLENLVKESGR